VAAATITRSPLTITMCVATQTTPDRPVMGNIGSGESGSH
jgi:hypothetical protein